MVQPSTSVSCERSFSMLMLMLRRLKTWLTQQTIISTLLGRHAPKTSGINSSLWWQFSPKSVELFYCTLDAVAPKSIEFATNSIWFGTEAYKSIEFATNSIWLRTEAPKRVEKATNISIRNQSVQKRRKSAINSQKRQKRR